MTHLVYSHFIRRSIVPARFKRLWWLMLVLAMACHRQQEDELQQYDEGGTFSAIDPQLIDQADTVLHWLDSMQLPSGLIETSYASNLISLYDNALGVCTFVCSGQYERAENILRFFNDRLNSEMLVGTGGYFQFRTASGPQGNRWLGDNAWLLLAIHNYEHATGDTQFAAMRDALDNWIRAQQDPDGGVTGGLDANGVVIGKVTEGMIDAFIAVQGFDAFHEGVLSYLEQARWDSTEQLLVSWPGSNYYYALDNFSWGYCAIEGFPNRVLGAADRFLNSQIHLPSQQQVEGYCFDEDLDVVWLEGTSQMAVAYLKSGNALKANALLHEVAKTRLNIPIWPGTWGIPYATNEATGYGDGVLWNGVDSQPATAASCWFVMACHGFDPMRVNYIKGIPGNSKFW